MYTFTRVTNSSLTAGNFLIVLALEVLCPEQPLRPRQNGTAGHPNLKAEGKERPFFVTTGKGWTKWKTYQNRFWNKIEFFFDSENTRVPTKGTHKSLRHGPLTAKFQSPNALSDRSWPDNESKRETIPDLTERTGNYLKSGKCCGGGRGRTLVVEKEGGYFCGFHSCKVPRISMLIKTFLGAFFLWNSLPATHQNNPVHILYTFSC